MSRRLAADSASNLVQAERDIRSRIGGQPLDFAAMAAVSNIYRAANVVRNHLERQILAGEDVSWAAFTVLFVIERLFPAFNQGEGTVSAGLSEEEKGHLAALLRKIIRSVEDS